MSFLNRSRIDDRNAKAHLAESYNDLCQQFSTYTQLQEVGNYKIIKQIGEGSFGKVFLAVHKFLHTKVVLKQGTKDDPNVVREVYYQREFRHPNITKLYEVIVTDCYIYMCLEYCPEGELYDHLIKYKRLPIPKIKKIFSQLCSSVYYIHQLNSCHRDLKLENILLDKKKHVKLADFGFTRELPTTGGIKNENTLLETICGTTVYMAPELISKTPYQGIQIDLWSLGVILYTITYGGMPFDEDDDLKTKYKIVNEEPYYKEDVPSDLIDLIKLLLNKDPAQRPSSLFPVLQHSFLEPYGVKQLEIVDVLLNKPIKPFQSKVEKNLLKKLTRLHIDTKLLIDNVNEKRADSLCGLWELMLEKERKVELQKRKKISRSRSVLRLSQAISSSSPRGHSRKNSFNTSTLTLILSNGNNYKDFEFDGCPPLIPQQKQQHQNFDSYSQTLNDDSVSSPTKSIQSTTRVNTTTSSSKSPVLTLSELNNRKQRSASLQSVLDSSISTSKKNNILKKLSKFWVGKINRKDGDESHEFKMDPQISPPRHRKTSISIEEPDKPKRLELLPQQPQQLQSGLQQPQSVQQQTHEQQQQQQQQSSPQTQSALSKSGSPQSPQLMKRSTSSSSGKMTMMRPASMISTYSSYSQLTTMSETSMGSDNNTSYSTDNTIQQQVLLQHGRPQYYRARSSDLSVYSKYSNGNKNELLSSNSSTTNISRTTSIDSSRSNSIKHRGRSKQLLKKNGNFFMKRGKSPLGQSNRFIMNKKKMGLLNNRKSRSSVIQEEYENSLTNSTSNLSISNDIVGNNNNNSSLTHSGSGAIASGGGSSINESYSHAIEGDIDEEDDYFDENIRN